MLPLAGYMLHRDAAVLDAQRRMARAFNLPVIWGTDWRLEGRSLSAARNAGVPVHRVKIVLFIVTAMSAVIFASVQVIEVGSADTLRGTLKEFDAIIAVVIGGTLLTGGYGSAVGAFLGALIYGTVQIGILYTGVDSDLFKVFLGMMVLLAVLFNNYVRRRATLAR